MGITYWREDAERAYVINSIQGIALEQAVWNAYFSCQARGREVFRQCAADHYDWSFNTVIAYANYEDNPPPQIVILPKAVPPVQPKPAPVTVKIDARDKKEDTTANGFINWMLLVKAATDKDKSLSYGYGPGRILKDGTIAVSVSVKRGDRFMSKVSFVFHFHPGVKGPTAGHGYASKWHFKPFDGAKKYVRLEDHNFNKLDANMVKTVKNIAKKK